jgi:exonuclease III
VITVNGTAWSSVIDLVKRTHANVILLQEHKLACPDDINAAKSLADTLGWLSVWSPAARGKLGKNSSGVAILARRGIGLIEYPIDTAHPERIIAATIEAPGLPPLLAMSVYCKQGIGMGGTNSSLLAEACNARWKAGMPGFLGGDFNASPDDVNRCGPKWGESYEYLSTMLPLALLVRFTLLLTSSFFSAELTMQ